MQNYRILAQHLPWLKSWRAIYLLLIAVISFLVPWYALRVVDRTTPAWSAAAQVGILALAFLWLSQYFRRRKANLERWGEKAYPRAFFQYVLVGLPAIFADVLHIAYLPGEKIVQGWVAIPVEILAWYLAITAILLDLRAIFVLGWDSLALLYVYFPEKGHLAHSSIYKIIRHPVYSALIHVSLALGLWGGTWLSVLFGIFLMPVSMLFWLILVEEPDLIERFGVRYTEYRDKTPAFWPRPADLGHFWRFLLLGDKSTQAAEGIADL